MREQQREQQQRTGEVRTWRHGEPKFEAEYPKVSDSIRIPQDRKLSAPGVHCAKFQRKTVPDGGSSQNL
jgi:hypothetical protein